jgi:polyribonucleotide nucleotidyltransferase
MEFGAFVNFFGAKDGLVHVSQLARERVEKPGDVVKEGDTVKVKLLGFDDRGKVRLSMKVVDQATGADLSAEMGEEAEDHGPRRGGGGDHRGPRRHGGGGRDRDRGDRGERRERKESAE